MKKTVINTNFLKLIQIFIICSVIIDVTYIHIRRDQSDESHYFSMESRRIGRTKQIHWQRSELGDQSEKEKLKVS